MNYTVLTFRKIQFLLGWTQDFSIDEMIVTYTPSGTQGKMLVVTESPDLGVHTVEFILNSTEKVLVSTQQNIVQIPTICELSSRGDITTCSRGKGI
jgi:hypothetical protein